MSPPRRLRALADTLCARSAWRALMWLCQSPRLRQLPGRLPPPSRASRLRLLRQEAASAPSAGPRYVPPMPSASRAGRVWAQRGASRMWARRRHTAVSAVQPHRLLPTAHRAPSRARQCRARPLRVARPVEVKPKLPLPLADWAACGAPPWAWPLPLRSMRCLAWPSSRTDKIRNTLIFPQ